MTTPQPRACYICSKYQSRSHLEVVPICKYCAHIFEIKERHITIDLSAQMKDAEFQFDFNRDNQTEDFTIPDNVPF
jgi:hypothetical protein